MISKFCSQVAAFYAYPHYDVLAGSPAFESTRVECKGQDDEPRVVDIAANGCDVAPHTGGFLVLTRVATGHDKHTGDLRKRGRSAG